MTEPVRKEPARPRAPTFPLRLPNSLRAAVDRLARNDGASVNQFIAMAVAEKVSAIATADEFERRAKSADLDAFDRIMNRDTPRPDRPDDQLRSS